MSRSSQTTCMGEHQRLILKSSLALFFIVLLMTPIASAADTRDSDNPFGVLDFLPWDHVWNAHHYGGDKPERAVALMKEAGVGFVRMDFIWSDIEPEKGQLDYSKYDRLVDLLDRNGIKVLGILGYNAAWAGADWNSPPDPASYTRYASAVVVRYKDRIKYWEVWNEPDHPNYWTPQDDFEAYTTLLKIVYPALKAEDPTCRVLVGGFSDEHPDRALKRMYELGAKDSFDIVNFHPFTNPRDPDAMKTLRTTYERVTAVMSQYGDGQKPIWITEIGCPGVSRLKKHSDWWKGENTNEKQQAEWLEKVYSEVPKWPGVQKVFWAFFRDTPDHFMNGTDFMGLVKEDFSEKPSFAVYRRLSSSFSRKS